MAPDPVQQVRSLVAGIEPGDDLTGAHQAAALDWLRRTQDVYRRVKPATPSPHLVSYFLLVDRATNTVLLCDHRLSGLWLPTGGHVEPEENPVDTVRREVAEELGIKARFDVETGATPFFLTVTDTVGDPTTGHTDVSLWFALEGHQGQALYPDEREFKSVRWWTINELHAAAPDRLEPHLLRAISALKLSTATVN
ncbi:NUDIX hydrolase [Allobranchiibius sp. CTAmp26]|uniref:NUDIX hydrolase n=1 Tax=Allobranchiibius sp. CTAmp26 TaxID=2815214 RepID=UPI001AA1691C|nr:NUDIX domain-containing protein [Allobranchiibius sp. CTAmp26]MBO1756548.1 NUDIX domain-containing protein [Allobranchiibius sp. CTAmp26]